MENSRKIKGFSKAIKIISSIINVFLIIAFIVLLSCSIVLFVLPDNLFAVNMHINAEVLVGGELLDVWPDIIAQTDLSTHITLNGATLIFNENGMSTAVEVFTFGPRIIAIYGLLAAMNLLMLGIAFKFAAKFGKIAEKTSAPLGEQSLNALNLTAKAFLVWSIGSTILNSATQIITKYIITGDFLLSFNLTAEGLGFIVLFLLLTYLLKYAAQEKMNKEEATFNYYND